MLRPTAADAVGRVRDTRPNVAAPARTDADRAGETTRAAAWKSDGMTAQRGKK